MFDSTLVLCQTSILYNITCNSIVLFDEYCRAECHLPGQVAANGLKGNDSLGIVMCGCFLFNFYQNNHQLKGKKSVYIRYNR